MASRVSRIEQDVERVSALMRKFGDRCYAQAEEDGHEESFRFDVLGIVAIVTFDDDEGGTEEDTAAVFETTRHYAQTGILVDLLSGRNISYFSS